MNDAGGLSITSSWKFLVHWVWRLKDFGPQEQRLLAVHWLRLSESTRQGSEILYWNFISGEITILQEAGK